MKITVFNDQHALDVSSVFVEELSFTVFEALEQALPDEVVIHFVDKKTIAELHKQFFNDPTPTDCISFPIDTPSDNNPSDYVLLGEIFVCPEVALEYAGEHNINPIHETALYIIHGLLHLLGYDDIEEEDTLKMRSLENLCMEAHFFGCRKASSIV